MSSMCSWLSLEAILLNVLFKKAKGGAADGPGHAAAHRPGRLGQAEGGAR